MNDPLKKYVQNNRDGFDHLEPSAAVFNNIKNKLKPKPKSTNKVFKILMNHKWMAAATILVTLSITYIVFNQTANKQLVTDQQLTNIKKSVVPELNTIENQQATHDSEIALPKQSLPKKQKLLAKRNTNRQEQQIDMVSIYANLTDSSSASKRLSAVLEVQRSSIINNDLILRLAKTLNNDPNSNVRVAVLDLLGKYVSDANVTDVLVQSLANQKDPLVQLGLINLLAKTNNKNLDEQLYALANNPYTFAQVKDQAYLTLLNQNKL